jgi:predicted nucleic acid-binding protein
MTHLDTNVLISIACEDPTSSQWVTEKINEREPLRVSSVTWYEFVTGPVEASQIELVEIILDSEPIAFDTHLAKQAAKYFNATGRARKRKVDTMIAATALLHGGKLATRNTKDFKLFEPLGLTLIKV